MTYAKTLELMRRKYEAAKDYTDDHWEGSERREHREYVDMLARAIEALEKQMPKKPIIRPYTNKRNSDKGYFCPRCDESIGTVGIPLDLDTVRFCGDCGQALLWDMKWEEELT